MSTPHTVRFAALFAITVATAGFVQISAQGALAGGGCRGTPVAEAAGDTVLMSESCFEPSILRVDPGQEVTWRNVSTQPHSVAGQNTSWGDYEEMSEGETVAHVFEKPGTYAYHCFVHNGMIGVVVVGDGKGALTGSVSRVDDSEEPPLASVPQADPQPDLVAPSTDATRSESAENDWLALTGVAVVALIMGGGAVALVRRR